MASAKRKGRISQGISDNLQGGLIQDFVDVPITSGFRATLDVSVYESKVQTDEDGIQVVILPGTFEAPLRLGQRHLVTYTSKVGYANTQVAISGSTVSGGSQIVIEGLRVSGVTSYAETAFARVSLLDVPDGALFEYKGLSGNVVATWNLLYLTGTAIPS